MLHDETINMFVYCLNIYVRPGDKYSIPPFEMEDAIPFSCIPTVSMDQIEIIWNHDKQLSIMLDHYDKEAYYFVTEESIPNTAMYRRLRLEVSHDPHDRNCDDYVRPFLTRFVDRLQRRIHTRTLLRMIAASIPYPPTEIEYHVKLLYELEREGDDYLYDRLLLQQIKNESRTIIKADQDYRPNGPGFEEAQQHFQETITANTDST
jgi:hypothetical protein